jgi:hypothetical protein
MATFVLVHGSWHDGSAWQPVIARLEELGHVAHAPTIAGHGKGVPKAVNHNDCVQSVVRFITGRALSAVVLAGHSFGGTVIARRRRNPRSATPPGLLERVRPRPRQQPQRRTAAALP